MTPLHRRIMEISAKKQLSHIGSNLSAVDIIDEIYSLKNPNEPFVLSSGHAGLALYVVLEKHEGHNAEELYDRFGTHPSMEKGLIPVSTGSLGWGLPIALGMAFADTKKNVYCLISDGEMFEGSIWEAILIKRKMWVPNLIIYMNFNGWGAYDPIDPLAVTFLCKVDVDIRVRDTRKWVLSQADHYKKIKMNV